MTLAAATSATPRIQRCRTFEELGELGKKSRLSVQTSSAPTHWPHSELALRSVGAGELQILAEPAFHHDQLAQIARDRSSMPAMRSRFRTSSRMGCSTPPFSTEWPASSRRWTVAAGTTQATYERKWSTEDPRQMGPFTSALIAAERGTVRQLS